MGILALEMLEEYYGADKKKLKKKGQGNGEVNAFEESRGSSGVDLSEDSAGLQGVVVMSCWLVMNPAEAE